MCKGVAVMRRRSDSWLNATQILKVAGFDKPQRTRVLEREIQKGEHEKVQGGYGKYQGASQRQTPSALIDHSSKVHGSLSSVVCSSQNNTTARTFYGPSLNSSLRRRAHRLPRSTWSRRRPGGPLGARARMAAFPTLVRAKQPKEVKSRTLWTRRCVDRRTGRCHLPPPELHPAHAHPLPSALPQSPPFPIEAPITPPLHPLRTRGSAKRLGARS